MPGRRDAEEGRRRGQEDGQGDRKSSALASNTPPAAPAHRSYLVFGEPFKCFAICCKLKRIKPIVSRQLPGQVGLGAPECSRENRPRAPKVRAAVMAVGGKRVWAENGRHKIVLKNFQLISSQFESRRPAF